MLTASTVIFKKSYILLNQLFKIQTKQRLQGEGKKL